ncbi:GumC family protein [Tellurirhabdus rosea]|uniref:GumC family protein n=1 Tax=Tellurirhabdus rosea TaxID=2674997 RepID=UPI00224F8BDE|nr:polysaccharide biosynthesis tyrosine autokinase [Tellurirhabdus rosea]
MKATTSHTYTTTPAYTKEEYVTSDLQSFVMRYLRNWKWFVLSLFVFAGLGFLYLKSVEPLYRITASLLVKDQQKGISETNALKEMDLFKPSRVVENEIEILKSHTLMQKAVESLGLQVRYYHKALFGPREVYDELPFRLQLIDPLPGLYKTDLTLQPVSAGTVRLGNQTYPVNQVLQTPYGRLRIEAPKPLEAAAEPLIVKTMPLRQATLVYSRSLKVEPSSKSSTVLLLTLDDPVPTKGEDLLNRLIKEYTAAEVEDKNRVVNKTMQFIEARLALVSKDLAEIENNIEKYKSANGITDMSAEAQTLLQRVQANDSQLSQVDIQLGALNDVERYVRAKTTNPGMVPASLGMNDPTLVGLISRASELELKRNDLLKTTSEQHPFVKGVNEQIALTKQNIRQTLGNLRESLEGTRQELLTRNARHEGMVRSVPNKERELMNITRQQSIKNGLYTYLLQKREETSLSYASTMADTRTIDLARSDATPIKPIASLILLLFSTLGLIVPMVAITLRDLLNNRVAQRSDVDEAVQVPVIGEISEARFKNPIIVREGDRSVAAEQIRALRTNLQFLRSGNDSLSLLLTSSVSGEGKSFVSLNLAASLALISRPTVLIDMDLRKPTLHTQLKLANSVGLSNYLTGEAELEDILQPVADIPYLWVIPCGMTPPNPSELLTSSRLDELFVKLRELFAFILVDAPPIGLVTDAQIIASHTDAALYMVRYKLTPKEALRKVETLYREQRLRKLALVLNGGDAKSAYQHNAYYSPQAREQPGVLKRLLQNPTLKNALN